MGQELCIEPCLKHNKSLDLDGPPARRAYAWRVTGADQDRMTANQQDRGNGCEEG